MSEVATPKGAAVEGISAMPLACEPLAGKCLRVLQKKGTETGESRVANLISVFSVRVQDDVASLGGIGARRSSTGERNYHRRESSQGGALDETTRQGDAETSRSPTKREEKAPLLLRDPQSSPSKDNPLKASVEGGTEASMTSEPAAHTSPIGKRKSSRLENNPFIQNDQKKLGEFGSPIKGGGLRRSQKNTNAVAHTEVTGVAQEHPPEVSKDNATSTGQQQCSEPQQNNVVPSQFKLVSQSPDFLRRNKLSASPDSPRKVPMTPPKVKGDVWSISLIPQQSAASSETGQGNHLVGSAEVQVKPPPPTSPSPQDDQEGHVYDDVVVAASAVVRQVEGSNGLGVIPVGMLPIASSELVREDSLGEMCLLVQFHDSTVPPGMVGGVPQPTGFRVEPAAEGTTATDMTVSLQSNEQEDINESFEVIDPKEAGSEEDLSKSPRSEKKYRWKLFGGKKKNKKPVESAEDEEQRKKKAAIKKRGSIPRTAIKLKPADEFPAGIPGVQSEGEARGEKQGEQGSTPDVPSRPDSASFLDTGGTSSLEQSEDGSSTTTGVSTAVVETSQRDTHPLGGSAPHSSHNRVSKSDRKDKTISREIYDIIVNGFEQSAGSRLGGVREQEEGGVQHLAVPLATSPQDSPRGMSDESSSESDPEDTSKRDTRSEGSPMRESPSGELAPKRRSSIMENSDTVETTPLMYADALWDHVGIKPGVLNFKVGDVVAILDMTDEGTWQGSVKEKTGWFQASFVRLRIAQGEDEDGQGPQTKAAADQVKADIVKPPVKDGVRRAQTIRRKDGSNAEPKKLSPSEVRAKIVEEILNTERDYVNHLRDIVEGYLQRCTEHTRLFNSEKIELIFGNVENIYKFQKDFLKELETKVNRDKMEDSQIGDIFVANATEFNIYSHYCNNHPHAVHEMNSLQLDDQYTFFFESCRLLQNLQDISLEGYLLTPVQKICKYPLQLSELLKYTSEDHPDYKSVKAAQDVMKGVALHINEQKRRMENVGKIGQWQETIADWKGEDILETSTELIYSGELHKISKGHSQERHFFLFDHQIIYCKKDAIGGKLTYKGRLCVDNCEIIDLQDGGVVYGGTAIRHAWKMSNKDKDKWYVVYAKTAAHKKEWMEAFEAERERVREDHDKEFHISLKVKKAAVTLCNATAASRHRRKSFQKKNAITESLDSAPRKMISANAKTKSVKKGAVIGSPVALKKSIS